MRRENCCSSKMELDYAKKIRMKRALGCQNRNTCKKSFYLSQKVLEFWYRPPPMWPSLSAGFSWNWGSTINHPGSYPFLECWASIDVRGQGQNESSAAQNHNSNTCPSDSKTILKVAIGYCLVVQKPSWKMMELVNGFRMTSHIWNGK